MYMSQLSASDLAGSFQFAVLDGLEWSEAMSDFNVYVSAECL